jgi:hypothetical protein
MCFANLSWKEKIKIKVNYFFANKAEYDLKKKKEEKW